jgi:hypothetical protein
MFRLSRIGSVFLDMMVVRSGEVTPEKDIYLDRRGLSAL